MKTWPKTRSKNRKITGSMEYGKLKYMGIRKISKIIKFRKGLFKQTFLRTCLIKKKLIDNNMFVYVLTLLENEHLTLFLGGILKVLWSITILSILC